MLPPGTHRANVGEEVTSESIVFRFDAGLLCRRCLPTTCRQLCYDISNRR